MEHQTLNTIELNIEEEIQTYQGSDSGAALTSSDLYNKLTEYYLGQNQSYSLIFSPEYVKLIDRVFDIIIRKHGIRTVNFTYSLNQKAD